MNNNANLSQPQANALANSLQQSLQRDLEELELLSTLLDEERAALEASDSERLEAMSQRKMQLSAALDKRAQTRRDELAAVQLATNNARDWLAALQNIEQLSGVKLWSLWENVETALLGCDRKLKINEKIVHAMHQTAQRFIDALAVENGHSNQQTYSAKPSSSSDVVAGRAPIASA